MQTFFFCYNELTDHAEQMLRGDIPSAALAYIIEPWFLGAGTCPDILLLLEIFEICTWKSPEFSFHGCMESSFVALVDKGDLPATRKMKRYRKANQSSTSTADTIVFFFLSVPNNTFCLWTAISLHNSYIHNNRRLGSRRSGICRLCRGNQGPAWRRILEIFGGIATPRRRCQAFGLDFGSYGG